MSIYRGKTRKEFYLTSSLYDAIEDHNLSAIVLLLSRGADANIVLPRVGISPFHLIIGNDDENFAIAVTKLILQHDGNPNLQSDDGLTPLHISAAWGRYQITEMLLFCGGDPYIQDRNGNTPFDYSIEFNQEEITKMFKTFSSNYDFDMVNEEQKVGYNLTLDKIIVNKGCAVGEYKTSYKIMDQLEMESSEILEDLPEFKTNEFLDDWFRDNMRKSSITTEDSMKSNSDEPCSIASTFSDRSDKIISINNLKFKKPDYPKFHSTKCSDIPKNTKDFDTVCKFYENSRESGINTLPNNSVEYTERSIDDKETPQTIDDKKRKIEIIVNENGKFTAKDTSSDYFSCNDESSSINPLEKNIFEITSDLSNNLNILSDLNLNSLPVELTTINCHATNVPGQLSNNVMLDSDETFVSVSEVYKYTDKEDGVVLYEKRLKVNSIRESSESEKSIARTQSSKLSSLPASIDYDTDRLRKDLQCSGFNPGPITVSTKRLYLKKLFRIKKEKSQSVITLEEKDKEFSTELEKTFQCQNWIDDLKLHKVLDENVTNQFSCKDRKRNWREGTSKCSFTYLLLDPRKTNNLPCRSDSLCFQDIWKTFLSSIFYVGKGKRSRPYAHLYDAANLWNLGVYSSTNKKIQRIIDIWKSGKGVVCLHVFQNIIPVEAYTREAAMISALGLKNIENVKGGEFYGVASTWSDDKKEMYGVYLLHKAMNIFLLEGERQLSPQDID